MGEVLGHIVVGSDELTHRRKAVQPRIEPEAPPAARAARIEPQQPPRETLGAKLKREALERGDVPKIEKPSIGDRSLREETRPTVRRRRLEDDEPA